MRMWVRPLASLSGLRIWRCCEPRCSLQTRLGSGIAVAVAKAGSCSSNLTPSLGTSICCGCSSKKTKDTHIKKSFILLALTCRPLIHFELIFICYEVGVQTYFSSGFRVVPASFVEETKVDP